MEYWDLYDRDGNMLDIKHVRGEPDIKGTFHMVVSNWIKDNNGNILIQKRTKPLGSLIDPWSTTAGAALMGETSLDAVQRETEEEMGLFFPKEEIRFVERVFYDVFFKDIFETIWNGRIEDVKFDPVEVADVKWVSVDQLVEMYEAKEFFDHKSEYFDRILDMKGQSEHAFF